MSQSAVESTAVSSFKDPTEDASQQDAPRRTSRVRKPTQKSTDAEESATIISQGNAMQLKPGDVEDRPGRRIFSIEITSDDDEADAENDGAAKETYCTCRGEDDGSFMISCERCDNWFHTRCVGLTQKEAKKLREYICAKCTANPPKPTPQAPKGKSINKYSSSTKNKQAGRTETTKKTSADKAAEKAQKLLFEQDDASDAASVELEENSDGSDDYQSQDSDSSEDEVDEHDSDHVDYTSSRSPAKSSGRPSRTMARSSRSSAAADKPSTVTADTVATGAAKVSKSTTAQESLGRRYKRKDSEEASTNSPKRAKAQSIYGGSPSKRRTSGTFDASEVSPHQRRPSSSLNKNVARKPSTSDSSTDDARARARKVLADALCNILSPPQEKVEPETAASDAEEGAAYAFELEAAIFETNADQMGRKKVVGTKYKDRFRTMLFSLKDAKNTTLHSKIRSGDLLPNDLAKMTSDELANDVRRQATEKARLDALHNSTLKVETGPLRKITHKGEIEIETDALAARDEPGKFEGLVLNDRVEEPSQSDDGIEFSGLRRHDSDRADPPVPHAEPEAVETNEEESRTSRPPVADSAKLTVPVSTMPSASPTTQLDFDSVWGVDANEPIGATEDDSMDVDPFSADIHQADDSTVGALDDADDFIDSFLEGKAGGNVDTTIPSSSSPSRSTTPRLKPASAAVHRYRPVMWSGEVDLPQEFNFRGHVKQVAGRSLVQKPELWSSFLPGKHASIAGRLPSKAAFDYLMQIGNSSKTEIVVFTMEPGQVTDGLLGISDADRRAFDGMLGFLKEADRWGALHIPAKVKGVLIKDLYLAPLFKDQEVPKWLNLAESNCLGSAWNKSRDRNMFLLVAVVVRDAFRRELSGSKAEAPVPIPTSDPDISIISVVTPDTSITASDGPATTFGPDALQSLLKTLGNTTAPHTTNRSPLRTEAPVGQPTFSYNPAPLGPAAPVRPVGYAPPAWNGGPPPHQHQQHFRPMPQQSWQQQPNYPGHNPRNGPAPSNQYWNGGQHVQQPMPAEEYPGQYNSDFVGGPNSSRGGHPQGGGNTFNTRGHGRGFHRGGRGW